MHATAVLLALRGYALYRYYDKPTGFRIALPPLVLGARLLKLYWPLTGRPKWVGIRCAGPSAYTEIDWHELPDSACAAIDLGHEFFNTY